MASSRIAILRRLLLGLLAVAVTGCATIDPYLPSFLRSPGSKKAVKMRSIAILPFAYRSEEVRRTCDVCPNPLIMTETSEESALLVTAFFYEALSRYPRFEIIPFETVSAYAADSMDEQLAQLTRDHRIDGVVVGGVLEMRERLGDPRHPTRTGGAAIYAAMPDVGSGEAIWAQYFEGTEYPPGFAYKTYKRLVDTVDERRPTAAEVAEYAVDRMVKSMSKSVK